MCGGESCAGDRICPCRTHVSLIRGIQLVCTLDVIRAVASTVVRRTSRSLGRWDHRHCSRCCGYLRLGTRPGVALYRRYTSTFLLSLPFGQRLRAHFNTGEHQPPYEFLRFCRCRCRTAPHTVVVSAVVSAAAAADAAVRRRTRMSLRLLPMQLRLWSLLQLRLLSRGADPLS